MDIKQFEDYSEERKYNALRKGVKKLGFYFFESGDYDLNIIAIRNSSALHSTKFNDYVALAYMIDGIKRVDLFKATTDPGRTYRLKPINKRGTAVLLPQQVPSGLITGLHKGYPALIQNKSFYVLRDNDKNDKIPLLSLLTRKELKVVYNIKTITDSLYTIYDSHGSKVCNLEYGKFGINFHRASKWKILESVGLYSAGCVVQQNPYRFRDVFLDIVGRSAKRFGSTFTMTLITNEHLV